MLRSDRWLTGDDDVALEHRASLGNAGVEVDKRGGRPLIAIVHSQSEFNPCNLPLRDVVGEARQGVAESGGVPIEVPVMTLGEDLMKPTAMLYRNLLAIEVEEMLRSYPVDGAVLLGGCDKSLPGAMMGAASTGLPSLVVVAGPRPGGHFEGRPVGSGTDLWRIWDERRAGLVDDQRWAAFEASLRTGPGTCNTMGTASTMAVLAEVLGWCIPGSSTVPAGHAAARRAARRTGQRAVELVHLGLGPRDLCTPASFRNAIRVMHAIGGSTNAAIHLAALAGRLGIGFDLHELDRLGRSIPLLVDVEPNGAGLVQDFHFSGGVPALLKVLRDDLEGDAPLANGETVSELASRAPAPGPTIAPRSAPLLEGGSFRVVSGSLAPGGALLKRSSSSRCLDKAGGRAVVFHGYHDMQRRLNDPSLDINENSVLVLTGCGPVGGPGMPEWGMIPLPRRLLDAGERDVVRVTDARMSGTSFGTIYLHVAPEAAVGGPLALVKDGDIIEVDADAGRLDLLVEPDEILARQAAWRPPASPHDRGWPALYRSHVMQAPDGCDLDFLRPSRSGALGLLEPVVGRS